jgi:hypothetical protein
MKFKIAEKGNRCIVRVPTWCCEAPTGSKHATLRLVLGPSERAPRRLARDRAVRLSDVHIKAVEGQSNKAGSGQPLDERGREPQNGNHLYLFCDCLATLTLHTHSRLRIRRLLPFLKSPASRFGPPTTKLSCGVVPYPTHPTSSTPQLREARASDPDSFTARAREVRSPRSLLSLNSLLRVVSEDLLHVCCIHHHLFRKI